MDFLFVKLNDSFAALDCSAYSIGLIVSIVFFSIVFYLVKALSVLTGYIVVYW